MGRMSRRSVCLIETEEKIRGREEAQADREAAGSATRSLPALPAKQDAHTRHFLRS